MKGLTAELRDARASDEYQRDVQRLNPLHTVPVLVDGDRVVSDSGAICHYLDRQWPAAPLWPAGIAGADAFQVVALVDGVLQTFADLGLRYRSLHGDPSFAAVREQMVQGRAQRALDALAARASARAPGEPLCGAWSCADMAVFTLVAWLESLPARAAVFPLVQHVIDLGWKLPPPLAAWAAPLRARPDVAALG